MFRNYLKVAIRALWRYKMFSVINVLEFTLGMTLCLLILLMMRDQSSYDTFNANKERIYRVISDVTEEDRARSFATSPAPMAGVHLENDTAVRFFPNEDPVGKAVHINGEEFLITGVLENPAGKTNLRFDGLASCIAYVRIDGQDFQVIGVTEDFHFSRIRHEIAPLVIRYHPKALRYALIRIYPDQVADALAHIETAWNTVNATNTLTYRFYEDEIAADHGMLKFKDSLQLFGGLAVCSIVITMLGLLGLVTYTTEVRLKEIAVRKVLGAKVSTIMFLLSKSFFKLLGMAIVTATPLAWGLDNLLLSPYAYRVEMTLGVIIILIIPVAGLLGLTIATQAFRGARINPAMMLRQE